MAVGAYSGLREGFYRFAVSLQFKKLSASLFEVGVAARDGLHIQF